jgi:hypothetical protein
MNESSAVAVHIVRGRVQSFQKFQSFQCHRVPVMSGERLELLKLAGTLEYRDY